MNCRNCGAELNAGATICSVCGRRVEKDDIPKVVNPAISSLNNKSLDRSSIEKKKLNDDPFANYKYEPKPTERDNTKYNKIDENDRFKATIINAIELIGIIVIMVIIVYFVYNFVFNE